MRFVIFPSGKDDEDDVDALPHLLGSETAPMIIEPLQSQVVELGNTLTLSCRLSQLPSAQLSWLVNNIPLEFDTRKSIERKNDVCTLVVTNARSEDEGEYTLIVRNSRGQCETRASVIVTKSINAPIFTKPLKSVTINEGELLKH